MADATAKAVIKVSADTQEAVRGIKKVTEAAKELGSTATKEASAAADYIKKIADGLGKYNQALEFVQRAWSGVNTAVDMAISKARQDAMEKLLPAGAVDRFRAATDRLIARQDVLRLSVRGLSGDFKLTEKEMTTVLRAAIALEQRGFGPAAETADRLIDALAKGVNKLDDFGINLEKTNDRQADVNKAMEKFNALIAETPVDKQTKSLTRLKDSLSQIAASIADIVTEAAKAIEWIRRNSKKPVDVAFGPWREFKKGWADLVGGEVGWGGGDAWDFVAGRRPLAPFVVGAAAHGANIADAERAVVFPGRAGRLIPSTGFGAAAFDSAALDALERSQAPRAPRVDYNVYRPEMLRGIEGSVGLDRGLSPDPGDFTGGFLARPGYRTDGGGFATGAPLVRAPSALDVLMPSLPGGMQGLQDQLADTMSLAGGVFATMSAGVTAAVDAAITGSEGIGKAAAKASAMVLRSLAIEATGRAAYEGALALGALAFGNAAAAKLHGLAAAKYAGAAALMGTLAGGLGQAVGAFGGGGGSAGPAGGGFASPGASTSSGGAGDTIVINIGGGFYGDANKLEEAVARGVREAKRKGHREGYTTSFSG